MSILDMNLNELEERLKASNAASHEMNRLGRTIQRIESSGFEMNAYNYSSDLCEDLKPETVDEIRKMILRDLRDQHEDVTEKFHNIITGGQK